jgi:hypothetical protein
MAAGWDQKRAEMSWDVFVMNLSPGTKSLDDIPTDYDPSLPGARGHHRENNSALSEGGFRRSVVGYARIAQALDEFALETEEQLRSAAVLVRGGEHSPDI